MFQHSFSDFAQSSKWHDFLNVDKIEKVFLSADIDWAPDFATEVVIQEVKKRNKNITLFATHPSDLLSEKDDSVEVGLHPDYTRANIKDGFRYQLEFLFKLFPNLCYHFSPHRC